MSDGDVIDEIDWKSIPKRSDSKLNLRRNPESSLVTLKWHMPICAEICRAEQKYMPFFGTITERDFREKIPNHGNIHKMIQRCALDFFPQNALGDSILDFFFRING